MIDLKPLMASFLMVSAIGSSVSNDSVVRLRPLPKIHATVGPKEKVPIAAKVESSYFEGLRKTLMVCSHSPAGVAPGGAAQSRGDGVGSGSKSAQALQTAIKTRVVPTGRRGGPSWTTSASGGTPERRLWAFQREDRRAPARHHMVLHLSLRWLSTAADWADRRTPASSDSCLPHCDLYGPVCGP